MTSPGGVNIATAFVSIVPSVQGVQGKLSEAFSGLDKEAGKSGGASGDSFLGGMKGKLLGGVAAVAVAAGVAFVDAYNDAIDKRNAVVKAGASMGLTPEESKALGESAGTLYAQGYGESLSGVVDSLSIVKSALRDLNGAELETATKRADSFAKAFDIDISDAVTSVSTLINSGLAPDSTKAFDLITVAAQKVPASLRGGVLEASDEYSQFFRTLGFDGDEAFGALVEGAKKGEFGIDKTGDAIKEFTIRSTDMSKTSVEAYQAIGLNAQDMSTAILAGGDTAKGAFDKIVDGLLGIEDPTLRSNTAIALFGTQMEDLNVADIPQFLEGLKGTAGALGDTAGAADKVDTAMGSTTSAVELFWRGIKTNIVDFFSEQVLPAITTITQWLAEKLGPAFASVGQWIETKLIPFLKLAWEWFEVNLLPTVMRVGEFIGETFGNILEIIGGIIDVIGGIFAGDWSRVWEGIKSIFGGIWDQIKNILSTVWDVIWGIITGIGPKIWEWLTGFASQLLDWGRTFLNWIWEGIKAVAEDVFDWFTSLPGWIWERISAFAGQLVEWGGQFIHWLWDGIVNVGEEVLAWFGSLPGWAWDRIAALAGFLIEKGGQFITWIKEGIVSGAQAIWDFVTGLPGKVWDLLLGLKDKILQLGKDFVNWIVEGIASVASNIWNAITDALESGQAARPADSLTGANEAGTTPGGINRGGLVAVRAAGGMAEFAAAEATLGRNWVRPNGRVIGPGGPVQDAIPTWLSNQEYVTNAAATAKNLPWLEHINAGGWMPGFPGAMATGGQAGTRIAAQKAGQDLAWAYANETIKAIKEGVSFAGNGQWGPANMGGLAANTAAARDYIMSAFGITNIGGFGGGSVPGSDHPLGKALDVMIANYRSPEGIGLGNRVADYFINNPNAFGTKYVIWRDRWDELDGTGWQPYSHPGGNDDTLAHRNHVHISFLTGSGQFSGQPVGDTARAPWLSALLGKLGVTAAGAMPGSGPVGAGVERWRPMALQALAATGESASWVNAMLSQMSRESSGDPRAINLTDSNARRGTPSMGLLQTIQSTFAGALRGTQWENLIPLGPMDPWANMIAAILYTRGEYGSLAKWNQSFAGPNPYDQGGWLGPGGTAVNMLNKPEAVLTPPESDALLTHAQALEQGFWGGPQSDMHIYLHTSDAALISAAEVVVDGAIRAATVELVR